MGKKKKIIIVFSIVILILIISEVVFVITNQRVKNESISEVLSMKKNNISNNEDNTFNNLYKEYMDFINDDIKIDGIKVDKENTDNENADKENEENYTNEYKEYLKLSDENKEKVQVIPRKENIEYDEIYKIIEKQKTELEKNNKEQEEKFKDDKQQEINEKDKENEKEDEKQEEITPQINQEELPDKFDLRDYININVDDQGTYGLCWDFASMNCVETNLALTQGKNYDFSEIHVDYLTSNLFSSNNYRKIHSAGNFREFKKYTQGFNKFVLEDTLEYYKDYKEEEYMNFEYVDSVDETLVETVEFPNYNKDSNWTKEQFETYQNAIKTHIKNYGSLYIYIAAPDEFKINHYYNDYSEQGNSYHAVSIIGWDDNYPKEKFLSPSGKMPEKDGAYIVLNSWGKIFGEEGYFYISYEDYLVHSDVCGVVSTNKKDLINLTNINNNELVKYIKDKYNNEIIDINGIEYIKPTCINNYYEDISNYNLTSLNGIEFFKDAKSINLSGNKLTHIDEIENLPFLRNIDLSNNKINDISVLKNCKELEYLNLSNNEIEDISIINDCKEILGLHINNNKIKRLPKLDQCEKLNTLDISNNEIEDVSNITDLKNLGSVNISNNKIKNIPNMNNCSELRFFFISNNDISEITSILENEQLVYLNISNTNIKDVSELSKLKNLYRLDISNNKDITGYSQIFSLMYLIAKDCNIKNIEDIGGLNQINHVDFSENKDIQNLQILNKLTTNYELILKNCNIQDAGDLPNNVEYADLSNNKGIHNLDKLENVEFLILENCDLNNIQEISKLNKLMQLNLSQNNIKDITQLKNCTELEYLNVSENTELCGDLKDSNIKIINISNCNIDKDFDFFGIEQIEDIYVNGNRISLQTINDKITYRSVHIDNISDYESNLIPDGSYVMANMIYKDIEIPKGDNVYIKMNNYQIGEISGDIKNNKFLSKGKLQKEKGKIVIKDIFTDKYSAENFVINYNYNANIKPKEIKVVKFPRKRNYRTGENFEFNDMKIEEIYENDIIRITNNYNIDTKFEDLVNGENKIKVTQGDLNCYFTIDFKDMSTLTYLKFENRDLFNYIRTLLKIDNIIEFDNDNKKLLISEQGIKELEEKIITISPSMLNDIKSLNQLKFTEINIEYNGNIIDQNILNELEKFPCLKVVSIINFTDNDDISFIGSSEKFIKNIKRDKLVLQFKNKDLFNEFYETVKIYANEEILNVDQEKLYIECNFNVIDKWGTNGISIKSSMIDDIECLNVFKFSDIEIKYDGTKIDEEAIEKLKKFQNLKILNIIKPKDKTEEDVIVKQDYFTVYFYDV